eukprot:g13548.t1
MEPVIIYKLFSSIRVLSRGINTLREHCIEGITANREHCKEMVHNSIGVVTALLPHIGYKKCTEAADRATRDKRPVADIIVELGFLKREERREFHEYNGAWILRDPQLTPPAGVTPAADLDEKDPKHGQRTVHEVYKAALGILQKDDVMRSTMGMRKDVADELMPLPVPLADTMLAALVTGINHLGGHVTDSEFVLSQFLLDSLIRSQALRVSLGGAGDYIQPEGSTSLGAFSASRVRPEFSNSSDDAVSGPEEGSSQTFLPSALQGLTDEEASTVKNRLRLRLGILPSTKMVSGQTLHEAVAALGLTRYEEEDMNDLVNHLADFIGLKFEDKGRKKEKRVTMMGNLFGAAAIEAKLVNQQATSTYNAVPAQALVEIFLARDGEIHKRIFGPRLITQFKAMREILLASDTNRLVAELTFVRINDLAAPPEPTHPLMRPRRNWGAPRAQKAHRGPQGP